MKAAFSVPSQECEQAPSLIKLIATNLIASGMIEDATPSEHNKFVDREKNKENGRRQGKREIKQNAKPTIWHFDNVKIR
ncbi:hypothetical protein TELCIR_16789 [Teladorsagia circumcincta]|uniref:Uncharacterized protein n=1 Tax=Teladorsagia circumcincta TaxID=45464 RepID=A0A2G9TWP9_TELCI|nr:hypothetical protein TELCIR_16789 [Teladorsagia circumcincta]